MKFDSIIKNGIVIDGTGKDRYFADIGIFDQKVVFIGKTDEKAEKYLDATNLFIAPGIVDILGRSDITVYDNPLCESKIFQGITTEVWGNCGLSFAPLPKKAHKNRQKIISTLSIVLGINSTEWNWNTFSEYLKNLPDLGLNIAPLVGHATLRSYVMGSNNTEPTEKEILQMEQLLQDCLDQGAFGMSTGLEYPPDYYSTQDELIRMCRILSNNNALYSTHMRNEDIHLMKSISETIEVSRRANCPANVSHLKLAGVENWGKSKKLLEYLEDAKNKGVDITWDAYPYTAWGSSLIDYIPKWVAADGRDTLTKRLNNTKLRAEIKAEIKKEIEDENHPLCAAPWDKVVIALASQSKNMKGKSIAEIADEQGSGTLDTVFDILRENCGAVKILVHCMDIKDVENILQHKDTIISTDSRAITYKGSLSNGSPHPRYCGSVPKVLRLAREGLFSFEEAIRKMTSLPADRIGLKNRGRIKVGGFADLIIFNPNTVKDNATYENPVQRPAGIDYVFVNGHLVINKGVHTGALKGEILKPN